MTYSNDNGVAGNIAIFTIKDEQSDTDAADSLAIVRKDVSMTGGNAATITIIPTDIPPTVIPGAYYYDIKVLDVSGAIYLVVSGVFLLIGTPTNRYT